MDKTQVTISRKWHAPQIHHHVTDDGITMKVTLEDFIEALTQELGPVTWVLTDKAFRAKLDAAIASVLSGIKAESSKVV